MAPGPRAFVIGLDGVPHRLVERYASDGTMPNLAKILATGTLRAMASSVPPVSCVAWSTIVTGKNAGVHGIYGFMELKPGTYRFSFPSFSDLKARPFWEEMPGRRVAVVNVPGTYPAREMNGALVAGFVALDLARATWPRTLVPELERLGYRIDVDAAKGHADMDAFLRDLGETLEARIRAARFLLARERWDVFFLAFTGTDRLAHFLFGAFDDEAHPRRADFAAHFRRLDEAIGEIHAAAGPDDLFMMLSDHGFTTLKREVNVNRALVEAGLLRVSNPSPESFEGVGEGSRAFALDPARIHVNLRGRYPRGCVDPGDRERVARDVADALRDLSVDGRRVIRRICRKEEIYEGPEFDRAPDLVLLSEPGFDLKGRLAAPALTSKGVFTGMHTHDDAFLFVSSPSIPPSGIPAEPRVGDVRGLVERGLAG
jgi:predicted AlkP superfamily phosphohydrolase/phosphomutase